jgi:hypothetical protein
MAATGVWHGLGHLKKLAIGHHLEIMLHGGLML